MTQCVVGTVVVRLRRYLSTDKAGPSLPTNNPYLITIYWTRSTSKTMAHVVIFPLNVSSRRRKTRFFDHLLQFYSLLQFLSLPQRFGQLAAMVLDDKCFAGSESGAHVDRVKKAVFLVYGPNHGQCRPEEAVMGAKTPENDETRGRIDVFDTHNAALRLQNGQTVNSVTFLHTLAQRR